MSDTSQGPGWWQASDGRWYPPQTEAGHTAEQPQSPRRGPKAPGRHRSGAGTPNKPGVQEPFVFRKMEPLDLDRDGDKPPRRSGLNLDRPEPRRTKQILGIGALTLVSLIVLMLGAYKIFGGSDDTETAAEPNPNSSTPRPQQTENTSVVGTTDEAKDQNPESEIASTFTINGEPVEETLTSVFDLATGDCFSPASETDDEPVILALVHILDCEDAHLAEVIKTTTLSGEKGAAYPGNAARDAESQRICQEAFETYVGHTLALSELGLLWLGPTEATWSEQDDRALTCAVQALDGFPLIGSVENSQR